MNSILLSVPPQFSFQQCLWFLDRNYDDCLHEVRENSVLKLLSVNEKPTLIEIKQLEENLQIEVILGEIDEEKICHFVKEWFDLERDLMPFYQLLKQDEDLKYMVSDYHGLRLLGIPDLFEALCWSIIGQQINLSFAYKLKRRLTETYGETQTYQNTDFYLFPKAEIIASLTVEELKNMQFSTRKAEYLIEIARHFSNGFLSKTMLESLSTEEAIKKLVSIRGIGEWTANYALMKSLKRLECVTYGDVGLYNALNSLKNFPKKPLRKDLNTFFEGFKDWEAYTVFYLWRSLAVKNTAIQ